MALLNLCNRSVKLVIVRGVVCTIDNDIRSTRNMRCIKLLMFCLLVPKGNNFICGSFQFKVFEASSSSLGVLKKKKLIPYPWPWGMLEKTSLIRTLRKNAVIKRSSVDFSLYKPAAKGNQVSTSFALRTP
jgi:hypothetical protein